MELNEFLNLLKKKRQTIFTIVFVLFMLSLLFSLSQGLKYTVKSRLLVVQNAYNSDAYVLSKSNEYLGGLFAEIVYSSSFYDQVLASQYGVNKNYFSGTYSQQIKKWHNVIETKTQGNTGIIGINVYHPQVNEAKKIALAVNDILMNKNQAYQGGQGVRINIIDQPIASSYPNKPDLPKNLLISILVSFIVSLFYIYLFPEEKYSLYLISSRRIKNKKIVKEKKEVEEIKLNYEPVKYNLSEDNYNQTDADDTSYKNLNGNINNIIKQ